MAQGVGFEDRFWAMVEKTDGCWLWRGASGKNGYGKIRRNGVRVMAHRASYELCVGPIPDGLKVCHHCDNGRCVNPSHLFVGSQRENMQDALKKGRLPVAHRRGESHYRSKLTTAQASEIKRLYACGRQHKHLARGEYTQSQIAKMVGCSPSTVNQIVRGVSWRHAVSR